MTEREYGFAIVGLGMGANRARQVADTSGARLVAVADLVAGLAQRVAAEHGADWTTDYHDLLARDDVDVIYVMTPSGLHAQIGIEAARAGKHVITTKPMETTLEKADALIAACAEAGVKLVVDFGQRYNPVSNQVKAALDRQAFGKLILAEARLKWYRGDEYYDGWHGTWALDGGGSLINQTVHYVDLLCWFLGPPQTVWGRVGVYNHRIETEDMSIVVLHYPDGYEGVIVCTTTFPETQPAGVEIHGTQGGVITGGSQLQFWKTANDISIDVPEHPASAAADMVQALRHQRRPYCDGMEGRKSLALIQAIYQSALNGERIVAFEGW